MGPQKYLLLRHIYDVFKLRKVASKAINYNYLKQNISFIKEYKFAHISKCIIKGLDGKYFKVLFMEKDPFNLETFQDYLIKTCHSLCQIMGKDVN